MRKLNIDIIENIITRCVQNVRNHLVENNISDDIVGYNPYGDASKKFDIEAEDALTDCIKENLKDVIILGEEKGIRSFGSKQLVIMIDPIDGSTNYESDIPWSAISIAVGISRNGRTSLRDTIFALLSEVSRDRIYIYRGGEVKIIGKKITRRKTPKRIVLGYFDSSRTFKALELYMHLHGNTKILRILGSASLDIISVAFGNAEIFIDTRGKLRNIDIVAALRIALALGAKAFIFGYKDPLDIPIDEVVKVNCIVGFNEEYLAKALEVVKQISVRD